MPSEDMLVREKYLERIRPYYELDTVKVIVGPRRAGKSFILRAVMDEIKADKEHKILIDFEDMDYDPIRTASDLNS